MIYGDGQDRKIWLEALERFVRTGKETVVKKALARWLRQQTTAGREWVGERLCMGEVSAVTRSIRIFRSGRDATVRSPPLGFSDRSAPHGAGFDFSMASVGASDYFTVIERLVLVCELRSFHFCCSAH